MKEKGRVVSTDGELVTLAFIKHDQCDSCGSSFCNVKERVFTAKNSSRIPLSKGDTVEVFLPPGKTIGASFFLLIFPLLLFVGLYMVAEYLMPNIGEGLKVLIGTAGLGIGIGIPLLGRLFRKRIGNSNDGEEGRHFPEIITKETVSREAQHT
jgi:positive regulator of sigma E activity